MFSIHTQSAAGRVSITVAGELDLATCPTLAAELAGALALATTEIVVDLAAVQFLDCRTVSVLLDARDRALLAGLRLRVRNVRGLPRQVLQLTDTAGALGLAEPDVATRIAG
jgi:anti-anti-sigma factor